MLDIKFIRENIDKVKKGCQAKQAKVEIDTLLDIDKKRREIIQAIEDMRAQKNQASKEIQKTENLEEKNKIIQKMREKDSDNDKLNREIKEIDEEFNNLMLQIPNLPFDDVPAGKNEKENVILRKWGEPTKFIFQPKNYLEIAEKLDLIDVKRAAKVSGSRFGYLKNEAALLEFALINFVFYFLTNSKEFKKIIQEKKLNVSANPFIPVIPPVMISEKAMEGMGHLANAGEQETYHFEKDKLYFVGTSEQSIGPMYMDEILQEKDLPCRYIGFSTCFRREAGSYGKDTKGILRVHHFDKLEMFSFCQTEKSTEEHQFILAIEEKLMQLLKIPYQVVQMCTGDLGMPAAAKYDIEAWLPSENCYRETHSCSNCTDFQARRLNIRYRNKLADKLNFVHTLNGTAFAIGRILIAIIENYQQKDGSILIPKILQKYLGFGKIKDKK
ncbi:serine--tRNA ligase [Patescibacteria group bacterium]|nr:serine--tRNA ligase [Patescibacteria group bacterium]